MAFVSRRSLIAIAVLALAALLAGYAAVWLGFYNVEADDRHTRPFYALLENVRDRSIARRGASRPRACGGFAQPDPEAGPEGVGTESAG